MSLFSHLVFNSGMWLEPCVFLLLLPSIFPIQLFIHFNNSGTVFLRDSSTTPPPYFPLHGSEWNWWAAICQDKNKNIRHQHLPKLFLPALPRGILGAWIFVLIIQIFPPLVLTKWVCAVSHCFLLHDADCCKSLLIRIPRLQQRWIPAFTLAKLHHKLQSL